MNEGPKKEEDKTKVRRPILIPKSRTLWCGKFQGLCDGSLCVDCHLFPTKHDRMSGEEGSTIDTPTLTDHKKVGLTSEEEPSK